MQERPIGEVPPASRWQGATTIAFLMAIGGAVQAAPVTMNFSDPAPLSAGTALDGLGTGAQLELGGLTVTFGVNTGVFNQTAGGFGVNATGAGDSTDELDGGTGILEAVSLRFDRPVTLVNLMLSGLGGSDVLDLQVGGGTQSAVTATSFVAGSYTGLLLGSLLSPGEALVIQFVAGNGISLDAITVEVVAAQVPGASSAWLAGVGALILLRGRHRWRVRPRRSPDPAPRRDRPVRPLRARRHAGRDAPE